MLGSRLGVAGESVGASEQWVDREAGEGVLGQSGSASVGVAPGERSDAS